MVNVTAWARVMAGDWWIRQGGVCAWGHGVSSESVVVKNILDLLF